MKKNVRSLVWVVLTVLAIGLGGVSATAAVQIIGTQYRVDQLFPEFFCFWSSGSYPTACGNPLPGATAYVHVKNTGASAVTVNDATLAGYSLQTVIKMSIQGSINPKMQNSIYFYWDNPPQDILDAGEPVWWKADPPTIPAGGVGQVAVRLRYVPVTQPISMGVVTSGGTVNTNIAVDANAPRVSSIGYSEDRTKVYLHWWRSAGAAPTSVWLNGTNVTSLTTTVGDPAMNFAASVINLPNALPHYSYHVYQGVYADGKKATAGQRAWTNKFIYATWSTFEETAQYTGEDWVDEASAHGFNASEMNQGNLPNDSYMLSHGYGYIILDVGKLRGGMDPDLWFINDEPDAEEQNQSNTHCGVGLRIPCDTSKYAGTLVMKEAVRFTAELHASRPNVPITVNLDGGLQPQSWYTWGPAVDVLESNNYYEVRLRDSWYSYPQRLPLYVKPKLSYAVARSGTAGAEPNPFRHILYSCKGQDPDWPYPFAQSKRIEAYYSLAGGSKGLGYWWLNPPRGLYTAAQAPALWKEMGLFGNEIKTARNLIVRSTPVDLPLAPSTNVWVRAVASGINTLMLYVVNDNFGNDISGCHITNVPNATVTVTLPSWMQSAPTVFEITTGGRPGDVGSSVNGNQMLLSLGTLTVTRMIIITTDPTLRTVIQARYDSVVRANVCSFAPELCVNSPPSITQQPVNRSVAPGGTTNFTTVASGSGTLNYQWQKTNANLANGGHYSGATTGTLTISSADNNDATNYRCIVANAYGSVTSSVVTLTITNLPAVPTANAATSVADNSFTANWSTASGATGYRLDVSTNNSFASFLSGYNNLDAGNVLSRNVTGLNSGTTYYYRVRAYNEAGSSGNSGTINLTTTTAQSPPAAPVATAVSGVWNTGFTANWNSAIGATGYRLDVSTNNTFSTTLVGHTNLDVGNVFSRNVTGLTTGATYYYRVRAYNGAGSSGNSGMIAVTLTAADPCLTIANPSFEVTGDGFLATNWTAWKTGSATVAGFIESTIVHGGAYSQRLKVSATNGAYAGVYQRVPVVAGQQLTAGVWMYAEDNLITGYLGLDPAGGTNANGAGVIWSSGTTNVAWVHKTLTGTATASTITLFLKVTTTDSVKRNIYFDDAIPDSCANQPPNLTQQPADQSILSGAVASYVVGASGTPPLYYQWQKNGSDLADGGHYAGSLTENLTITGVDNADVADYRCVITNAFGATNSDNASLEMIVPNPCLPIANSDFESGFSLAGGGTIANNWTEWEAVPGVVTGYDEASNVHGGAHAQRIRVGGTNATSGGVYQRIPVTSGQAYTVSVWTYCDTSLTSCWLGVDPAGGTNAASGVTWSAGTTNVAWVQQTWVGIATASYLTIFYKVATPDIVKRYGTFDDATPASANGPLQLLAQGDGSTLTLTWPECPGAHLERADDLAAPVWTTVPDQASVTNGLKSVTLIPQSGTGFFRLVLE